MLVALLLASAASAQVLSITSGGRRVIDREPESAETNCLGWSFGPAPRLGDHGELVGMYTTSDALTQHCRAGIGLDSAQRFGDAIQFHTLRDDGSWSEGVNVIDRTKLRWMNDFAFLINNQQSFVGHVASPSVVERDGRLFMAFAASLDDRNLCAGEHYAGNGCGSCFDPWSYFALVWAVSDDGINWRVRERAPGDPTFLGRPPAAAERSFSSYKGLTRVSLIARDDYFYLAAQYWSRSAIKTVMFRVPYDASSQWGTAGEPELWSAKRRAWIAAPNGRPPDFIDDPFDYSLASFSGFLGSIVRTRLFGAEQFLALNPDNNRIVYQTSQNLVDWTPPVVMRRAIPFFADGFGYDVSVIDPVAIDGTDGKLHLFFASNDGDADHGIPRDGRHDCGLYTSFGPTAPYLGTGVYEGIVEPLTLRATATSLSASKLGRFEVRVTAARSTPEGNVVVADAGGEFRIVPLVNGIASVDVPLLTPGAHKIYAWYDAQGQWDASRSPAITQIVPVPPRQRAVR